MWNQVSNEVKIGVWTLVINISFLVSYTGYINNHGSYYPETPIDLAYSFYKDNSLTNYTARTSYKNGVQVAQSHTPRKIPIFEAPAYAWLMGLLWKVTGSLKMYDIQIFQMLLFVFSCMLLYWTLKLFFDDENKALYAALAIPVFFPLMFLNINPVRDIFCFYGIVVLLYLITLTIYKKSSILKNALGGAFIAICQWIRQTVFGSLGAVSVFLIFYFYMFDQKKYSQIIKLLIILWAMNIAVFWVPWVSLNKHIHGRYFAGQTGQLLLDSMGWTGPNKINPNCPDTNNGLYCDGCVTNYTINRFNLDTTKIKIGSPEMDDKMKEAFWEWFEKDPSFWFKGLLWRIKKVMFLDMTWSTTHGLNWEYYNSFPSYTQRLRLAYSKGTYDLFEFLFRRWHVRSVMFLGYIGAVFLVYEYGVLLLGLLFSLVAGGIVPAVLSHPEHRYLTPFYFVFPLLAGYAIYMSLCALRFLYQMKFLKVLSKRRNRYACKKI